MKVITLVLLFASIVYFASAQLYPTVLEQYGNVKSTGEVIENPNRSVPQGILIYSQPFSCPPYSGLLSEALGTNAETADDFIITTSSPIDIVRWWFFILDDPNTTSWIIRIYDNQNCLPSALLQTWNIAAGAVNNEYVCRLWGMSIYDCWANLIPAFSPLPNVNYWISIQAVGYEEYWCSYGNSGDYLNCIGAFKSAYWGAPDFIPDNMIYPDNGYPPNDFTYELYSNAPIPETVPVSNWAIGLGIFLILAAGVLRFRRMI